MSGDGILLTSLWSDLHAGPIRSRTSAEYREYSHPQSAVLDVCRRTTSAKDLHAEVRSSPRTF